MLLEGDEGDDQQGDAEGHGEREPGPLRYRQGGAGDADPLASLWFPRGTLPAGHHHGDLPSRSNAGGPAQEYAGGSADEDRA
jgi:hypothetical protein